MAMDRDEFRIETINGMRFRIEEFDALSGGVACLFVTKKLIPLLAAFDIDITKVLNKEAKNGMQDIIKTIAPVLEGINPDDLKQFMALCLAQVEMEKPAGWQKVYQNGMFGVNEVKKSTKLAFTLCFQVAKGLMTDFFGEGGLSFLSGLKSTMSQ
jgi:hypothetical protein